MTNFRSYLLSLFLSPIILILIISSINLRQSTTIKILTWKSPNISLGILMATGCSLGALLSFLSSYSINQSSITLNRKTHRVINPEEPEMNDLEDNYQEFINKFGSDESYSNTQRPPERPIGEASPVIPVNYRIIKKGTGKGSNEHYYYGKYKEDNETLDDRYEFNDRNETSEDELELNESTKFNNSNTRIEEDDWNDNNLEW